MNSERELWRFRVALLLAAAVVCAFYWFGYRNFAAWAGSQDKPTVEAWKKLVATAKGNPHVRALDPAAIAASVQQMQQAVTLLEQATQLARARIALDDETKGRMSEQFQLLDFDRARRELMAELRKAAAARKVTLADAAVNGLPDYTPDLVQPALLWAQLTLAHQLLATAIACEPKAIQSLVLLPHKTYFSRETRQPLLEEFLMRVELTGPTDRLLRLLASLPLRGPELEAVGPPVPGKNQALFLDRFILKNAPANPDEAVLELVTSSLCEPLPPSLSRDSRFEP